MICLFVTLAACGSTQVKITFETNTKETLEEVVIEKGAKLACIDTTCGYVVSK